VPRPRPTGLFRASHHYRAEQGWSRQDDACACPRIGIRGTGRLGVHARRRPSKQPVELAPGSDRSGQEDSRIAVEDASQLRDSDIGAAIGRAREAAQLVVVDSEGTSNFKTAYAAMDSDFVVIPTRSSRLDLERTVETSDMLEKMCRGVPYRVLITQTGQVARSKAEWEIDGQIRKALPTFTDQMFTLDAFRAMSNYRMTLAEVEAANLAKTEKARRIAQSVLADILSEIQNKEAVDA
jgi:chromosome partitioning protein